MDGSSSKRDEIRKGPWKAEEDEVLINHVRKYGPRDWSSIRSKGLLQRTGKSCRLRWVNKLRPNLKNGCKFSAEEERIVIELQSQFGNKWARIATYLPGRTDNDVKNFWSSRQKRLQRILQSSAAATAAAKPQKIKSAGPVSHDVPANEAPKLSSSTEEDESSSSKARCFSMDNSDNSKMMFLSEYQIPIELDFKPYDGLPSNLRSEPLFPQMSQTQGGPLFLPESQDFLGRLEEPNLFNSFAPIETSEIPIPIPIPIPGKFPPEMPFLEMSGGCRCSGLNSGLDSSISEVINDRFFEDFPTDMLDDVGSPPHCPARSGC